MSVRGIALNMVLNKVSTHCLFMMHLYQIDSLPDRQTAVSA